MGNVQVTEPQIFGVVRIEMGPQWLAEGSWMQVIRFYGETGEPYTVIAQGDKPIVIERS